MYSRLRRPLNTEHRPNRIVNDRRRNRIISHAFRRNVKTTTHGKRAARTTDANETYTILHVLCMSDKRRLFYDDYRGKEYNVADGRACLGRRTIPATYKLYIYIYTERSRSPRPVETVRIICFGDADRGNTSVKTFEFSNGVLLLAFDQYARRRFAEFILLYYR